MTDKQIIIYKKECYNEPHCSLNQVLEQLNAYKMEADEGKEINAELKAELEQEKALKETYLACYKAKHEDIEGKLFKLSKTLTEIKEIGKKSMREGKMLSGGWLYQFIEQKISEVVE